MMIRAIDTEAAGAALKLVQCLLQIQRLVRRAPITALAVSMVVGYLWRGL